LTPRGASAAEECYEGTVSDASPGKEEFLYPRSTYRGEFTPESLVFNSNLQEFAHKVGYICTLETSGKLSQAEAYDRIRDLWKALKRSRKELGIEE
jgi:hypothetical protein